MFADLFASTSPLQLIGAALLGYLLGSIPFGLLLTRMAGLGDIRAIGSRNIGTTNVLRTGRKDLAAGTLFLDGLKGALAVIIVRWWAGLDAALVAGFFAFIGHLFPVWIGFKGGKGVATYLGLLFAFAWPAGLFFMAVWIGVAFTTRYSSASALTATVLSPLFLLIFEDTRVGVLFAILSIIVWIMHRANIRRLLTGTESRIGQKA